MDVECCAHTCHKLHVQRLKIVGHETFLVGRADADPKDIGLRGRDVAAQKVLLWPHQRPKWWGVRSDNPDSWDHLFKFFFKTLSNSRPAPIKIMTIPARDRQSAKLQHVVWTIDATHCLMPLSASHPYRWHPIGQAQSGPIQNASQLRITLRLHYAVDAGEADVPTAAALKELVGYRDRLLQTSCMNANPKNIGARYVRSVNRPHTPSRERRGPPSQVRA